MSEFQALLLGLVQGLTEFLPVSSSGHLVMLQGLFGLELEGVTFEVTVHVATLVSVLVFYRKRVAALVAGALRGGGDDIAYGAKLGLATVPAVVVVLAFGDLVESQFEAPHVAGICLLVTGGLLWTTRRTLNPSGSVVPSWTAALLIGCAQAFALLPGISRSGSTVAAALALGMAPAAAAEFSFLMSVIAIAGAAVRTLPEVAGAGGVDAGTLALGGIVALLSGIAAIGLFVRMLRAGALYHYAYYTWTVGAAFLLWLAIR